MHQGDGRLIEVKVICQMAKKGKYRIPGVSFSINRALGITALKTKVARSTGVPTTRGGRQRKIGSAMGCALPLMFFASSVFAVCAIAGRFLA